MNVWYSALIYTSLKAGLPITLFIAKDGELGVKIDNVEFPYFTWESFEDPIESKEEIDKAEIILRKIIDLKIKEE